MYRVTLSINEYNTLIDLRLSVSDLVLLSDRLGLEVEDVSFILLGPNSCISESMRNDLVNLNKI